MGPLHVLPSPLGLGLAAVAVVLGAPLFSDGLRALRLRRHLRGLRETGLEASTQGFVHTSGRVALESPMFSPLGGEPCAGFQLEIAAEGRPVRRQIEVRRAFRIVDRGVTALVPAAGGTWRLAPTGTRRIAADEPMSAHLAALFDTLPEVAWLRRGGVALQITERALLAGYECHVVGSARATAAVAYAEAAEMLRTGTDEEIVTTDDLLAVAAEPVRVRGRSGRVPPREPEVTISTGEHLDFLLVASRAPAAAELHVPAWRPAGVVVGPALTLAGMFYLAAAADFVRAAGRL